MFRGAWIFQVNLDALGRMESAGRKLPCFMKEINCLLVIYKLDGRYKDEELAIRRLFGILEVKVNFLLSRTACVMGDRSFSLLLPKFTIAICNSICLTEEYLTMRH